MGITRHSSATEVRADDSEGAILRWPDTSDAWRFFALTFGISWLLWGSLLVFGDFPGAPILGFAAVFGPLLAAGVLIRRRRGTLAPLWRPILRWRVGVRWYAVVLAGPVLLIVLAAVVARTLGLDTSSPSSSWAAFPVVLLYSIVLGGGSEEPGWRGFAQPVLQGRFTALTSAVIVGVAWGLWHLPPFFIPGTTLYESGLNLGLYLLYVPGVAVLLAWIYNATRGSVLMCILAHGAANAAIAVGFPIGGLASQAVLVTTVWLFALLVILRCGPDLGRTPPVAALHGRYR